MERTFTIAPHFYPPRSPLGRWIARRLGDDRAAESTYLVIAVALGTGLLASQYLAWAYLHPLTSGETMSFVAAQIVLATIYAAVALVGRQPARQVTMTSDDVRVRQYDESLRVPLSDVRAVSIISAQTYYGHYRRYAATRAVVNRIHPMLLLLDVAGRPVVLGLDPEDILEAERLLDRGVRSRTSPHVAAT